MMIFWKSLHWIYRTLLSPAIHLISGSPMGCRFEPTCSHYMEEAVQIHGAARGGLLGIKRILRCQPFSSGPFHDPVPPPDTGFINPL